MSTFINKLDAQSKEDWITEDLKLTENSKEFVIPSIEVVEALLRKFKNLKNLQFHILGKKGS